MRPNAAQSRALMLLALPFFFVANMLLFVPAKSLPLVIGQFLFFAAALILFAAAVVVGRRKRLADWLLAQKLG